jgi:hypothetical protein
MIICKSVAVLNIINGFSKNPGRTSNLNNLS